jgi:hypothetical protein
MNINDFINHCLTLKGDIDFTYSSVISEFGYEKEECFNNYYAQSGMYNFNFKNKYFYKFMKDCRIIVDVKNEIGGTFSFGFVIFDNLGKWFYPVSYKNSYNSLDSLKTSMIIKFKEFGILPAEEAIIKDIIE